MEILGLEDSIRWLDDTIRGLEDSLREFLELRPPGYEEACATSLDELFVNKEEECIAINPVMWGAAEFLSEAYRPVTDPDEVEPEDAVDLTIAMAHEAARLSELRYLLEQGTRSLVSPAGDGAADGPPELQPVSRLHPDYAVWTRRSHAWTRWTQLSLHTAPDSSIKEPGFAAALVESDPNASLFAKMMSFGLPIAPLNSLHEIQIMKRYAQTIPEALENLGSPSVSALCGLLQSLVGEAGLAPHASHSTGESVRIDSTLAEEQGAVHKRLVAGSDDLLTPVLLPVEDAYWFSPEMAQGLLRTTLRLRTMESGQAVSKLAGDIFEEFVSRLLSEIGYQVGWKGELLVGYSCTRDLKNEIDVVAWNNEDLLFVEAKCEMENPGAWAEPSMGRRIGCLGHYREALVEKGERWREVLASSDPRVFDENQTPLKLKSGLLNGRELKLLLVSVRVEPRPPDGPVEVVTYMPSLAVEVASRRLAPVDRFASFWSGESPPV